MATGSTKSGRKPRQHAGAPRGLWAQPVGAQPSAPAADEAISRRTWIVASVAIMLAAFVLRAVALELRPMHHDEGVNGHFLLALLRSGSYRYDPSNYHGPTLYYFTLPLAYAAEKLGALSTWVVRLVPLAFGLATVWLGLAFRRYVGRFGALTAAALMAVSPGMVFFSRYFIHEMMFVFFTVAAVVAALKFYEAGDGRTTGENEERQQMDSQATASADVLYGVGAAVASAALVAGSLWLAYNSAQLRLGLAAVGFAFAATLALLWSYDGARSIYLVLGAISLGLLFATKETAFISVGVILIAWASTEVWMRIAARLWPRSQQESRAKKGRDRRAAQSAEAAVVRPLRVVERLGGWPRIALLAAVSVGLFLFTNVLYYSSFFTNQKGVKDSIEAYKIWKKTGESGFHGYGWHKYFQWLVFDWNTWGFGEEPLLLAFAALGFLFALWRARRRFPLFAALWGFGLLAAYSIIKYKTPWLVLSMLPPFALAAGYCFNVLYHRGGRSVAVVLVGLCVAVAAVQSYRVNFVHYDSDRYPYVYAHTKRSFHDLIAQIERIAARTPDKYAASLNVAVENQEYWPLPWYVRDYKRIGYIGRVTQTSDDMILVKDKQVPELEALLGRRYRRVGDAYELRPGVKLVLYARNDLTF